MIYYHCSPIPNLKVLEPKISIKFGGEKVVYMTSLYPMALMYGINNYEYTYGYHFVNGKATSIYYLEHYKNALEKLYKGKRAYLYICENGNYKTTKKSNEYVSKNPVKIIDTIIIDDVYEELLNLEKNNSLEIIRYEQADKEKLDWIRNVETNEILERNLLHESSPFADYMKENYPESWKDALNISIKIN